MHPKAWGTQSWLHAKRSLKRLPNGVPRRPSNTKAAPCSAAIADWPVHPARCPWNRRKQPSARRWSIIAALVLAQRRLSATYGRNAPWKDDYNSRLLSALAGGESKLARITFPLGTLGSSVPVKLRFVRVGEGHDSQGTESAAVWSAPADAAIPGNSFFAILPGNAVSEGERLVAYAPTGAAEEGVVVPLSAVLMADSKYWCYVEERPGVFVRTEIDERTPTDAGYFVKGGIVAGARVVTTSAGQLLAREINPTSTAEEP